MAWVRIDDKAMTHPKIVGLSDKAFRLWVWGLAYCQQHLTDGRIPLAAVVSAPAVRIAHQLVDAHLWQPLEPSGWLVHDYTDWNDSREEAEAKKEKARERMRGVRANFPRRTSHEVPVRLGSSSVGSSSGSEEKKARKDDPGKSGFDLFWAVYPNKKGKDDARKAWEKRHPHDALTDLIIAAVERQKHWPDWTKDSGRFIPHPATWLNRGSWEDESTVAVVSRVSDIGRQNAANAEEALRILEERDAVQR